MSNAQQIEKRKPGFARRPDHTVTQEALRHRRMQDRRATEALAEQVAVQSATAAAKSLTPKDMAPDLQDLIRERTAESMRLLVTHGPDVNKACLDKAIGGDTTAMAMIIKFCTTSKTTVKLPNAKGRTIEETADSIVAAAACGEMPVEDASSVLKLLEQHSAVTLNGSLVSRLEALTARLNEAKARNLVQADVTIARPVITLEAFLEPQR
jgi:hypothetical protein